MVLQIMVLPYRYLIQDYYIFTNYTVRKSYLKNKRLSTIREEYSKNAN